MSTSARWHPASLATLGPGHPVWRSLLLSLLLLAPGCRDLDVVTNAYATTAEAEQSGAIGQGWMPTILPKSAHDIFEAHDLDRKRQWGLFDFPPSDGEALRSTLRVEELPVTGLTCDIPARIEFWPRILRDQLDPTLVTTAGLKVYLSRQGDLNVAVNWNQGRAYYWTR
jgi:hypothetical protein